MLRLFGCRTQAWKCWICVNLKDYLPGSFHLFCEEQIFLISLSLLFFLSGVWAFLVCGVGVFWSGFVDCVTALYLIVNQVHLVMKVGLNLVWLFKKNNAHTEPAACRKHSCHLWLCSTQASDTVGVCVCITAGLHSFLFYSHVCLTQT